MVSPAPKSQPHTWDLLKASELVALPAISLEGVEREFDLGTLRRKAERAYQAVTPSHKIISVPKLSSAEEQNISERTEQFSDSLNISHTLAKILAARGFINLNEVQSYLSPSLSEIPDPAKLLGAVVAADLVIETILRGERIGIFSDYDVDGTTSRVILDTFLNYFGVDPFSATPDRESQSYGLKAEMIEKARAVGVKLVIALDFGTKNFDEIALARRLGMEIIVIDHHRLDRNLGAPLGARLLNPHRQGCGYGGGLFCSAELTARFCEVIQRRIIERRIPSLIEFALEIPENFSNVYEAIAIHADQMPRVGANRAIVRRGNIEFLQSESPGIAALRDLGGVNDLPWAADFDFIYGPLGNAPGRIVSLMDFPRPGADIFYQLLRAENQERALELAQLVHQINSQRQLLQRACYYDVLSQIPDQIDRDVAVVIPSSLPRAEGVIGPTASNLAEQCQVPAVVGCQGRAGVFRLSGRAVQGTNWVNLERAFSYAMGGLEPAAAKKFGGHEGAAAASIPYAYLGEFRARLVDDIAEQRQGVDTRPFVVPDVEIPYAQFVADLPRLSSELFSMEPTGRGNEAAKILLRNLTVAITKNLNGADEVKRAIEIAVHGGDDHQTVVMNFWTYPSHPALVAGSKVDLVVRLYKDRVHPNGRHGAQLEILAAAHSEAG